MIRLFFIILLCPLLSFSQKSWTYYLPSASVMFVSGSMDGMAEEMNYHYPKFKKAFGISNDNFWNPEISWKNKWQNGDPNQGEAFLGSSTIFVSTTDAYHLTRTLRDVGIFTTIAIQFGSKPKFKDICISMGISAVSYYMGKGIIHTYVQNQKL